MANDRKKTGDNTDYAALVRALKADGPGRVYLLWGEESYLRDDYVRTLRRLCVDGDTDSFNYRRFDGESAGLERIEEAVNAMPFLAERTMVEVTSFPIHALGENQAEQFKALLADIPEYCTLVLTMPPETEPDGRRSAVKAVKKYGQSIAFTAQRQDQLVSWIRRRFEALGKTVTRSAAERLIFLSGSLMNSLIPEIEKAAAYAAGKEVTEREIDAVVTRLPEARVFEMTDCIAARDFNGAAAAMAELLQTKEHPIMLTAMIGQQMRRLYGARLVIEAGQNSAAVGEMFGIKYDFIITKLMSAARRLSLEGLARGVELCEETDLAMKSSGSDDEDLLRDLLLRLSMEAVV